MKNPSNRTLEKARRKEARKQLPLSKKIVRWLGMAGLCLVILFLVLFSVGTVVQAAGLVDETINVSNEYSKYSLSNYQLDFYVDNSWGWLPWNWLDGIGKSVMYGLYAITNFIWTLSLYISNATGYLVQEAYSLDFISQTTDSIGKNMQTLAGITPKGFSSSGFYVGFLLIFVLILGIYVTYTGLIKRETTRAIQAVLNFVVVFLLSASFIAYAPDYISKINDFSKDISTASLDVGTKIVLPNSDTKGKDSVDMIRDSLFSVQVKQPWLLLQYGTTDIDSLGAERVENLVSTNPDTNKGEDREKIVIDEIEKQDNNNLTITQTIPRMGTVFFLFIFNIGISIFVFILTGLMIFSQVLFIIFAMFLPMSFLLSMIPGFESMSKKAIMKLFNVIMTRAGITLVITVAFSISTMMYSLTNDAPFFMVMFLQIVTFAGIYFNLGNILSMFSLQSNDSQNTSRRMLRRPRMFMHRQTRKLQRSMNRASGNNSASKKNQSTNATAKQTKANHERDNATADKRKEKQSLGKQLGEKAGNLADTKKRMTDKATDVKDQVKSTPTNMKYAVHKGKKDLVQNANDFKQTASDTKKKKQEERLEKRNVNRNSLAQKRLEMDKAKQDKIKTEPYASMQKQQREYEERKQTVTTSATKETKTPRTQSKSHDERKSYASRENKGQPKKQPSTKKANNGKKQ